MATVQTNQKVFVSPGVYTSETDLSFVAQSVGVTTLGLVGETLKGPAFEPIFITNYDEFQAYFGGTEPTKFVNTQIPKYEAAYIAKAYLQQSNQLFVTRVLGLSGYDAGPSWSIKLTANVDGTTVGLNPSAGTPWSVSFSGVSSATTVSLLGSIAPEIDNNLSTVYTLSDGSTSTYSNDFATILSELAVTPSLTASTLIAYGSINQDDYNSLIGTYSDVNNVYGVNSVDIELNELTSGDNDPWYYANFSNYSADNYSGYSWDYVVTDLFTGANSTFSGTISGNVYTLSGTAYSDYNNLVVATLRSRGISLYTNSASSPNHGPLYQVSATTGVTLVCSGSYADVSKNPFATFLISGVTNDNTSFSFETSLSESDSKFITKVLGIDNFGKSRTEVPVFVEEAYPGMLNYLYNKGYIRGISCDLISLDSARSRDINSIAWNLEKYTTPKTPFLVSELRGNKVYNLFRFVSISDGTAANTEVKVSIANLSFNNMTFDVLVRSFFDTDNNPVVVEKFTNCTMDPSSNNFVAKKIGSVDGEYALISRYIMVEMADEYPVDALPCGFNGYTQRIYDVDTNKSPIAIFKTKYNYPGEVIYNPPFGGSSNTTESPGDVVRRTYLGFSTQLGPDLSFLQYKGKQNPVTGWATATDSLPWNYLTQGFHMDSGATVVTIGDAFVTSGQPAFQCGVANFTQDPSTQENPYYFIYSRKYTVCFAEGFDGWDIYREFRTNEDRFALGANGFLAGFIADARYPTATGDGTFKRIVVQNNTQDFANSDYYAYLLGILTFANPESTNINVFATSSIDYVNNSNLVEQAIEMVQFSRADSVYICTTPDYNMFLPD